MHDVKCQGAPTVEVGSRQMISMLAWSLIMIDTLAHSGVQAECDSGSKFCCSGPETKTGFPPAVASPSHSGTASETLNMFRVHAGNHLQAYA